MGKEYGVLSRFLLSYDGAFYVIYKMGLSNEKVTAEKLDKQLEEYKNAGITTVSVMEDDINSLVSAGELTCIKYNVLLHK